MMYCDTCDTEVIERKWFALPAYAKPRFLSNKFNIIFPEYRMCPKCKEKTFRFTTIAVLDKYDCNNYILNLNNTLGITSEKE